MEAYSISDPIVVVLCCFLPYLLSELSQLLLRQLIRLARRNGETLFFWGDGLLSLLIREYLIRQYVKEYMIYSYIICR